MTTLRVLLAGAIFAACSTTTSPSERPDSGPSVDAVAVDVVAVDAPPATADAPDAEVPETCETARPIASSWVVPSSAGAEGPRCLATVGERDWAWATIEVPPRAVLVLRSAEPSQAPDLVALVDDCAAAACVDTARAAVDGFVVRRFFNNGPSARTLRVAARRGVIVFARIERTPPNLRCDDAAIIDHIGPVVVDDSLPAIDAAPACPEVRDGVAPVRWYRVALDYLEGNTLLVDAPPDIDVRLVTACDAPACAAAPYRQIYDATRTVLRWPRARGATTPLLLAVTRRLANPMSTAPITFRVDIESGIAGRLCDDSIRVDGTLDLRDFETRSGAEQVAVCEDAFGRSTRMRWFEVWLQPGQSLFAHATEANSTTRTTWQRYDSCADRRCGVYATPTPSATTLEFANPGPDVRGYRLALGNLQAEYVDALRVRVRAFTPAAHGRCEAARRLAPNAVVEREDLTTGAEGPPPCAAGGPRRALWYVTTVPPGHVLTPRLFNRTETAARVDVPNACPAGECTDSFANHTAVPIEVTYAVSQDPRLGLLATYDLVASVVPLP